MRRKKKTLVINISKRKLDKMQAEFEKKVRQERKQFQIFSRITQKEKEVVKI